MQKVISGFLMSVCFVAGVCMLVAGMVSLVGRGGGYEKTVGYFLKSDIYSTDSDGNTTYSLTYEYYVSNEIYTVKTDVGVSSVPENGRKQRLCIIPKTRPTHIFRQRTVRTC